MWSVLSLDPRYAYLTFVQTATPECESTKWKRDKAIKDGLRVDECMVETNQTATREVGRVCLGKWLCSRYIVQERTLEWQKVNDISCE